MKGEVVAAWESLWYKVWIPLSLREDAPPDLFCELYRELAPKLRVPLSAQDLADVIDSQEQSQSAFEAVTSSDIGGEVLAVRFLEDAYVAIDDFGVPEFTDAYFELLRSFIETFNLRYDLQPPCNLSPTLPGLFANLLCDLRSHVNGHYHLKGLMDDFEHAMRDLRVDQSERRIKTCIQKQFNLLEAVARSAPCVTHSTLGRACDQLQTWPHDKVREAMKNLYQFASDYPGIRHGGTPANAIQPIGPRDLVAISILLTGFVPYLCDQIDPLTVYTGR